MNNLATVLEEHRLSEKEIAACKICLLEQITHAAILAVPTYDPTEATLLPIYPRGKKPYFWRVKWILLWRLEGLKEPLWLGQDGVIYRAYSEGGGSSLECFQSGIATMHHVMVAEIEKRKLRGLQRLLYVLTPDPEE